MSSPTSHLPTDHAAQAQQTRSPLEPFAEHVPQLGEDVFVHETAAIIGQVTLGDRVNIWPQVTLRADEGEIKIGEDTNIQDGTTVHMTGGYSHTMIGARVTVGHMCLLHGCRVGDDCLIGMGTLLLDNCEIGEGSYIAAGTMITGNKKIPPRSFVMGRPGSLVIKPITDQRTQEREYSWRHYVELAQTYLKRSGHTITSLGFALCLGGLSMLQIGCAASERPYQSAESQIQVKTVNFNTIKRHFYNYGDFTRGALDVFSHSREVIELTQERPLTINYRSFSSPRLDEAIERASALYAQYRFSERVTRSFEQLIKARYGADIMSQNFTTLKGKINPNEDPESFAIIARFARALQISTATHGALIERVINSIDELRSWRGLADADLRRDPNLINLRAAMEVEVKRASLALQSLLSGAPMLSKRMGELGGAAAAATRVVAAPANPEGTPDSSAEEASPEDATDGSGAPAKT